VGQLGPNAIIEPPKSVPARGGFDPFVVTGNGDRWELGFEFLPESTAVTGDDLSDPCSGADRTDPPALTSVEYQPWEVSTSFTCEAPGFTPSELESRVLKQLDRVVNRNLGAELWRGDRSQAESWPNNWLANSGTYTDLTPGSGSRPLVYALADLQQGLLDASNEAGVIHATARLASLWFSADLIWLEDGKLVDLYGNTIITQPGYDGSDDNGAVVATHETEWAYATGPIEVRHGPVEIVTEPVSVVDRETNTVRIHASRFVAAYWDNVVHLAINVDLCTTCCTPAVD